MAAGLYNLRWRSRLEGSAVTSQLHAPLWLGQQRCKEAQLARGGCSHRVLCRLHGHATARPGTCLLAAVTGAFVDFRVALCQRRCVAPVIALPFEESTFHLLCSAKQGSVDQVIPENSKGDEEAAASEAAQPSTGPVPFLRAFTALKSPSNRHIFCFPTAVCKKVISGRKPRQQIHITSST